MPNLRVGLLGAGGIATTHAVVVRSLPGVELVGIADVDGPRARRLAARFGVDGWFTSLGELMAGARPDLVHILLPPDLHARFAIEAMAAGAHVLVEKPLCVSYDECRAVEAAARQLGRVVAVNHNVTFEPTFLRLIEAIRARRIGAVQHVAVYWSVPYGDNSFGQPLYRRLGAAAHLLETGPHPLSLLVRLVGEARQAAALVSSRLGREPDTWQVALECERGTAQLFLGVTRPFTETRVRVIGEDGVAEADLRLGNVTVVENTRSSPLFFRLADTLSLARALASSAARGFVARARRIPGGGATDELGPMMRASLADFYDAVRAGRAPTASLGEGLAVVRTCLRAIDAAAPPPPPRATAPAAAATAEEEPTWPSATVSS